MQDDLTDAVHWAIAQGIADPARVAIYGGSYGGYAALAGAMLTPDLYRCAVNYLGPSELGVVYKGFGGDADLGSNEFNYQAAWVAPDADYAAATSPVNLVDRLRIPMLHVYGENDARVDIRHWYRLEAQLKKAGKPYEIVLEKEQGHGFRNQRASLNFYRRLEQFLAAHLR
jgi:dipeptidyl aminopeptidase/acylaminoacyl peptidase